MRFPTAYALRTQLSTGVKGVTGTAPQTVAGNALDSGLASLCLGARVYAKAGTTNLTLTGKWQVLDDDGVTWIDCVESNNPANVVLVTAAANVTKMVTAPLAITAGNRSARFVVVSAAATGGGAGTDECSIAYDFRMPVSAFGS
jgi:hypothetical protein